MSQMYKNADMLGKSRAVINVSVTYKNVGALVFLKQKAIATGTLIEFVE